MHIRQEAAQDYDSGEKGSSKRRGLFVHLGFLSGGTFQIAVQAGDRGWNFGRVKCLEFEGQRTRAEGTVWSILYILPLSRTLGTKPQL